MSDNFLLLLKSVDGGVHSSNFPLTIFFLHESGFPFSATGGIILLKTYPGALSVELHINIIYQRGQRVGLRMRFNVGAYKIIDFRPAQGFGSTILRKINVGFCYVWRLHPVALPFFVIALKGGFSFIVDGSQNCRFFLLKVDSLGGLFGLFGGCGWLAASQLHALEQ